MNLSSLSTEMEAILVVSFNTSKQNNTQSSAQSSRQSSTGTGSSGNSKSLSITSVFPNGYGSKSASKSSTSTQTNPGTGGTATSGTASKPSDYIASSGFMSALKSRLETTTDDAASYLQSQQMLAALKQGTLEVSDPTSGKAIAAWDPDQKVTTKPKSTAIEKSNWADFLNEHLKKDDSGHLEKTAYGGYVDKAPGENAFFGRVAGKYYYVTWPTQTKT